MAHGDFKDLNRRTTADKVLHVKHLIFLKIRYMIDTNVELLQWFLNFLLKKLLMEQLKMKLGLIKY